MADSAEVPAGDFAAWLDAFRAAQRGAGDAAVPCDGCTACCTSAQFVPIGIDEADALAHIPSDLLVAAPGAADGHLVLGFDERGWCPMLTDAGCSIYDHRPRACRAYDCRAFAAAGVEPDGTAAVQLTRRVRTWRFGHPSAADRHRHDAVVAAARFVAADERLAADGMRPRRPADLAVLAIAVHETFLDLDGDAVLGVVEPAPDEVRVAVRCAHGSRA